MVPRCTVCAHPLSPAIDQQIIAGVSYRPLSKEYGLSPSAICRHAKHLTRYLKYQRREKDQAHQREVLDKLDLLEHRLGRLFHDAQRFNRFRVALECLREHARLLSLQEKIRLRLED